MESADVKNSSKMETTPEKKIEAEVQASPKSSPTKKDIDVKTKALNLYTQGKRHLIVQDIPAAVNALQEASKLFAEEFGDLSEECAEPYFYYGKALLELARIESGVLGNALDGEEQKDEVSEKVGEAIEENYKKIERLSLNKHVSEEDNDEDVKTNGDVSDKVNGEAEQSKDEEMVPADEKKETTSNDSEESENKSQDEEAGDKSQEEEEEGDKSQEDEEGDKSQEDEMDEAGEAQVEGEEAQVEGEDVEGDKTEEDDEVGNLQLSWEILELSKVIYKKQLSDNKSIALKLAQVHLKLGEVGLENENYPQSVEDIKDCIQIQEDNLVSDDRCLAESYYQLGVAHSFSDDFDKSSECFERAAKVIEERKSNLLAIKKEKEAWTVEQRIKAAEICEDPLYSEQGEIEELEKLLPDIKEKITDMEEMKKDCKEKFAKVKEAAFATLLGGSSGTSNGASTSAASSSAFSPSTIAGPSKPVSNISHLVKKKIVDKRKPEEEMNGHTAKKTKLDETPVNGIDSDATKETSKMEVNTAE